MKVLRGLRFIPVLICMAAIFWFSSQPATVVTNAAKPLYQNVPTITVGTSFKILWPKVGHFVGYGMLGLTLMFALGTENKKTILYSIGTTIFNAMSDEVHQMFIPGRTASFRDVVLDTAAASLVILLYYLLARMRKPKSPLLEKTDSLMQRE